MRVPLRLAPAHLGRRGLGAAAGATGAAAAPTLPCRALPCPARLQGATPLQCKRWSFRSSDGACRLFKSGSDVRAVSLQGATPKDQQWYSGTGVAGAEGGLQGGRRGRVPLPHRCPNARLSLGLSLPGRLLQRSATCPSQTRAGWSRARRSASSFQWAAVWVAWLPAARGAVRRRRRRAGQRRPSRRLCSPLTMKSLASRPRAEPAHEPPGRHLHARACCLPPSAAHVRPSHFVPGCSPT